MTILYPVQGQGYIFNYSDDILPMLMHLPEDVEIMTMLLKK